MTDTKTFHIGDILSITAGALVSPRHIGGVYDLLGWMVSEDLMTHQLPRVSRECEPFLREQFPDLAAITTPDWSDLPDDRDRAAEIVYAWLGEQVAQHGETRDVPKLPGEDHTPINPLTELSLLRPDAPVVVITPEETA